MKKYLTYLSIVFVLTLFVLPTFALAQTEWVPPPSGPNQPPDCLDASIPGCNPPINTSDTLQTKLGTLIVGGLRSVVGIGIGSGTGVSPNVLLDIIGNQPGQVEARIKNTNTGPNTRAQVTLYADSNSEYFSFSRRGATNPAATGGPFATIFWNSSNSPQIFYNDDKEVMRITGTGDVGIGRSPQAKLDVNGNICYVNNGTRTCLGSDSSGTPTPGDGVGDDFLYTTWDGCIVGGGCLIRSGDPGPTAMPVLGVLNMGTWRMTCPAGYHVINGGADCKPPIPISGATKISSLTSSWPASETSWEVQCTSFFLSYLGWFTDPTFDAIKKASITCAK